MSEDGRLWLEVTGGLGNRLRALCSGAEWAAAHGRSFRLCWPVHRRFGARVEDLFENHYPQVGRVTFRLVALVSGHRSPAAAAAAPPRRLLVVSTHERFPGPDGQPMDITAAAADLRPTPAVVERIGATGTWDRPMVGVFIRAHADAHARTRRDSPPEWFYRRMGEIREAHPDVGFFLSTDTPAVGREVHRRFGDVWEQPDKGPHNSRTGLIAAVADLYLLGGTCYLLGSTYSSFTSMARVLGGGVELETTDRPPTRDVATCLRTVATPRFGRPAS